MLFIYNPYAGKGLIKTKIADILDIFVKSGYMPTAYPTQGYKDGYKVALAFEEDYDLLVCSGGDGTLDEVVSAMMKREKRIPIGYIPAGSTNDFAHSLKISRNILEAAEVAVTGKPFHCDIGDFNGDTFVYIAAFGIFTDVSYATSQDMKNVLGHLAYVLEGVKRIYNVPSYKMKVTYNGDQHLKGDYLYGMVTNSRSVGGFKAIVGKNIVFDDGEFEVTLIRRPKTLIELQEIVAALLIEQIDSKYMESFKANTITFDCKEEIPWTLDGEFGGEHDRVCIKNCKQALDIMLVERVHDEEQTRNS